MPFVKNIFIENLTQSEAAGVRGKNLGWVAKSAGKHVLLVSDHHPLVPAVKGQGVHVGGTLLLRRHPPLLSAAGGVTVCVAGFGLARLLPGFGSSSPFGLAGYSYF